MKPLGRRKVLTAAGATAALVVVAGGAEWARLLPGWHAAEADADEFVRLLSDVHEDYINGRVVEHEGWVLSQHEFDTIAQRQQEQAAKAAPAPVS